MSEYDYDSDDEYYYSTYEEIDCESSDARQHQGVVLSRIATKQQIAYKTIIDQSYDWSIPGADMPLLEYKKALKQLKYDPYMKSWKNEWHTYVYRRMTLLTIALKQSTIGPAMALLRNDMVDGGHNALLEPISVIYGVERQVLQNIHDILSLLPIKTLAKMVERTMSDLYFDGKGEKICKLVSAGADLSIMEFDWAKLEAWWPGGVCNALSAGVRPTNLTDIWPLLSKEGFARYTISIRDGAWVRRAPAIAHWKARRVALHARMR